MPLDQAEVGDDASAEPARVGALAECVDDAGDLAARDGGEFRGGGVGAEGALAQGCVEEVYAGRGDGDADLAGAGYGVLGLFVAEVLGRSEGVEADGVHGGLPCVACRVGSRADPGRAGPDPFVVPTLRPQVRLRSSASVVRSVVRLVARSARDAASSPLLNDTSESSPGAATWSPAR